MDKISIIIPAYNEERRIGKTLETYSSYFNELSDRKELQYEILVVINNTKDKTEEVVKAAQKKNNKIKYLNFKQGGKGFAVIEGFKDALKRENNLIGFVDADMATPPQEYLKLVKAVEKFDGVIADRYIKGSQVFPPATFRRLIVSRIFNSLVRAMLFMPYRDTQCGAKLFKRKAVETVLRELGMSKWAFDVELIFKLRKMGFKIVPVPTKWFDMKYSKINFIKAGPWMALGILRLRIITSPLKRFIRVYDKFIGFIPK